MIYTAPEILLFIAAIGAALSGVIASWRTGTKTGTLLTRTKEIHDLTNNTHERVKTELLQANTTLAAVRIDLVEAKAEIVTLRALVAQLASGKPTP